MQKNLDLISVRPGFPYGRKRVVTIEIDCKPRLEPISTTITTRLRPYGNQAEDLVDLVIIQSQGFVNSIMVVASQRTMYMSLYIVHSQAALHSHASLGKYLTIHFEIIAEVFPLITNLINVPCNRP